VRAESGRDRGFAVGPMRGYKLLRRVCHIAGYG
jgi:hypothetical protein